MGKTGIDCVLNQDIKFVTSGGSDGIAVRGTAKGLAYGRHGMIESLCDHLAGGHRLAPTQRMHNQPIQNNLNRFCKLIIASEKVMSIEDNERLQTNSKFVQNHNGWENQYKSTEKEPRGLIDFAQRVFYSIDIVYNLV